MHLQIETGRPSFVYQENVGGLFSVQRMGNFIGTDSVVIQACSSVLCCGFCNGLQKCWVGWEHGARWIEREQGIRHERPWNLGHLEKPIEVFRAADENPSQMSNFRHFQAIGKRASSRSRTCRRNYIFH